MDLVGLPSHNSRQRRIIFTVTTGIAVALTFIASCSLLTCLEFATESDELRSNLHYSQQYFEATKASENIASGVFITFVFLSTALFSVAVKAKWKVHKVFRWFGAFTSVVITSYGLSYIWLAGVAPDPVYWVVDIIKQQISGLVPSS
jgi:hypothetical protein